MALDVATFVVNLSIGDIASEYHVMASNLGPFVVSKASSIHFVLSALGHVLPL